ncbi:ER membrane protein complex subunit 9 isoform X2 [Carettochelys insculpta]|uniref:ER membrane protein complex subunit 9 isoform X2 n=1 Tax=Carettochelys insculpta TaxID=44489 RepID=UPI003EBD6D97
MEVEVSARAYAKMHLHCARHPHAAVNGLLLGRWGGPPECVCLSDCVPLFHGPLALSPMLEVDVWASRSGLFLAGYYQANAGLDEQSPTPLALKLASRLAELFEGAVLIMLDNRKLSPSPRVPPLTVLEQCERHWVPKDKNLIMWRDWDSSRHLGKALLEAKAHTRLVDFDAHLDDIRRDWTNQHLNAEIARLASVANGNA